MERHVVQVCISTGFARAHKVTHTQHAHTHTRTHTHSHAHTHTHTHMHTHTNTHSLSLTHTHIHAHTHTHHRCAADGEWHNGARHGTGTTNYTGGAKYTGAFQDGVFNGQGRSGRLCHIWAECVSKPFWVIPNACQPDARSQHALSPSVCRLTCPDACNLG